MPKARFVPEERVTSEVTGVVITRTYPGRTIKVIFKNGIEFKLTFNGRSQWSEWDGEHWSYINPGDIVTFEKPGERRKRFDKTDYEALGLIQIDWYRGGKEHISSGWIEERNITTPEPLAALS